MNKYLDIQLNNPYNVAKQVSLFGIEDMQYKEQEQNVVIASNSAGGGTALAGADFVGQSWLQTKNTSKIKISVKWDNPSSSGGASYPELTRILKIHKVVGGSLSTVIYTGTIQSPFLNTSDRITVGYDVDINLISGEQYAFVINKQNSGDEGIYLVRDNSGNYADGNAFVVGLTRIYDLQFKIEAIVTEVNANIIIPTSNYQKLVESLRLNPQYFNNIKVISSNSSQRMNVLNILLKDGLGNEDINSLIVGDYASNKDFGDITEIQLKEPILLGKKELKYTLEPNTNVTLIFSNKKVPKENKVIIKKTNKNKIFNKQIIEDFKQKSKNEKVKIIVEVFGITSFLLLLIRKVVL